MPHMRNGGNGPGLRISVSQCGSAVQHCQGEYPGPERIPGHGYSSGQGVYGPHLYPDMGTNGILKLCRSYGHVHSGNLKWLKWEARRDESIQIEGDRSRCHMIIQILPDTKGYRDILPWTVPDVPVWCSILEYKCIKINGMCTVCVSQYSGKLHNVVLPEFLL